MRIDIGVEVQDEVPIFLQVSVGMGGYLWLDLEECPVIYHFLYAGLLGAGGGEIPFEAIIGNGAFPPFQIHHIFSHRSVEPLSPD
jgi:hypothetical protein